MTGRLCQAFLLPCLLGLAACSVAEDYSGDGPTTGGVQRAAAGRQTSPEGAGKPGGSVAGLPAKYVKAFMCAFDENPIAAFHRVHQTPGGRAERAGDLATLRSLGFKRESRDGDLDSVGGKIAPPAGLTIFGLPVRSLEINGMIGDTNALYATTFADGVGVAQVVKAAGLEMNRASYAKYKIRHYSRRVGNNPRIEAFLDDRGGGAVLLSCQIQATPD